MTFIEIEKLYEIMDKVKSAKLGVDFVSASAPSASLCWDKRNGEELMLEIPQDLEKYGIAGVVWNCCRALIEFFQNETHILEGANVLELGAGTAALGLSLSAWGEISSVILTDLEKVTQFISRNVTALAASNNKIRAMVTERKITVIPYIWGNPINRIDENIDIILCSDCLYEEKFYPDLLKSLLLLSEKTTRVGDLIFRPVIFLSYKMRFPRSEMSFFRHAAQFFAISVYGRDDSKPLAFHDDMIFVCKLERLESDLIKE